MLRQFILCSNFHFFGKKEQKINCAIGAPYNRKNCPREYFRATSPKMRTSFFAKSIFFAYFFCCDKKSKIKEKEDKRKGSDLKTIIKIRA
jgi:hypothetical protein